jgi:hypothetical protein
VVAAIVVAYICCLATVASVYCEWLKAVLRYDAAVLEARRRHPSAPPN